ncbi:PAS domain-containing sensor histidine kinase [Natronospira bacteriovora]|uniref:histidine kinase n=1 Tax=Natronospira bacteriovora TaxID=3069753 RepID=A0ABU0W4Y0_9GAMM|nr:PAS domain S-box protein [Natronospira sp. AB-CW4]MDQ2069032.1 PAS domain S-box protein [Natronospira sp. AB-CW4]
MDHDVVHAQAPSAEHHARLLDAVLAQGGQLIFALAPKGQVLLFNAACERLTGHPAAEVIGQAPDPVLMTSEEARHLRKALQSASTPGSSTTIRCQWRIRAGPDRMLQLSASPVIDDQGQLLCHLLTAPPPPRPDPRVIDAEQKTGDRSTDLEQLLKALPGLVAHISPDFEILFANHAYRDWFGLDPEAQRGKHLKDVIGRQAFRILKGHFRQALAGQHALFQGEVPYARGGPRFIHGNYIPSHDPAGDINGFYILSVDLSHEQSLERKLDRTSRRAETIINTAIDGIITIDETGTVHSFNPAAERLFGYQAAEVIGHNLNMLMPKPERDKHDQYIDNYLRTGKAGIIGIGREVTGRHRDDKPIDLLLSVAEFDESGRRMFVGITHDLTQRNRIRNEARKYLDQLAQLNRVDALGEMTANLAHEIRQPLLAIQASAYAMRQQNGTATLQTPIDDNLDRIERQSKRVNDILNQITSFLRNEDDPPDKDLDIYSLVCEVLRLLDHDARLSNIRVEIDIPDTPCHIKSHSVQIQQVLFNLVSNAMDAMDHTPGPHEIRIVARHDKPKNQCWVDIIDTGPGIAEKDMEKLFTPFFTTKTRGMGQGLAISRSIIRRHGGTLEGSNHPQGGACFRLTLPLTGEKHEPV